MELNCPYPPCNGETLQVQREELRESRWRLGGKIRCENFEGVMGNRLAYRAVQFTGESLVKMARLDAIEAHGAHDGQKKHAAEPTRASNRGEPAVGR